MNWLTLVLSAAAISAISMSANADVVVEVSGKSGPWGWSNGGLNTDYQYGDGDQSTPTLVTASTAAGISITPGDTLEINYLDGTWNAGPSGSSHTCDANGYTSSFPRGEPVPWNSPSEAFNDTAYPAYYCPASEFPMNWMNCVGVFTDSSGSIVGSPFAINDNWTVVIPTGATQLQMGADDGGFSDNNGEVEMRITEAAPEPGTLALAALGLSTAAAWVGWKRRTNGKASASQDEAGILRLPRRSAPLEAVRRAA